MVATIAFVGTYKRKSSFEGVLGGARFCPPTVSCCRAASRGIVVVVAVRVVATFPPTVVTAATVVESVVVSVLVVFVRLPSVKLSPQTSPIALTRRITMPPVFSRKVIPFRDLQK